MAGSSLLISLLEKLNLFCVTSLITLVLLMWKWMGLFLKKNHVLKSFGLSFSSKLDLGSYIISSVKTALKKIGALIRSMKCLSPEVAPYTALHGILLSCLGRFCSVHVETLAKLQKRIYKTVDSLLAASFEPLAHRGIAASWSLFYRYYFGRSSSRLGRLFPLPYS